MAFDHFDERFKEVPMQELCLFANDMRVRMLVRASMYASSCMWAVARMCPWLGAWFAVLVLACMLTSMSVCFINFRLCASVCVLCPGLRMRLCIKLVRTIPKLCPRG